MTITTGRAETVYGSGAREPRRRRLATSLGVGTYARRVLMLLVSLGVGLGLWFLIADLVNEPLFFPTPGATLSGARDLVSQGLLLKSIRVSWARIAVGWSIGCAAGIPLGLMMGQFSLVRRLAEPYVEFFRFIPPISFLTLAVTWFGLGETAKVILIVWTTLFIVAISSMSGILGVEREKIEAAGSLGANKRQIFFTVMLPASVPQIVLGSKLAMGNSFMTVISAEMIAANAGIGWLIFNSRLYLLTTWIFVGIITLGLMGLVTDLALRLFVRAFLSKYNIKM